MRCRVFNVILIQAGLARADGSPRRSLTFSQSSSSVSLRGGVDTGGTSDMMAMSTTRFFLRKLRLENRTSRVTGLGSRRELHPLHLSLRRDLSFFDVVNSFQLSSSFYRSGEGSLSSLMPRVVYRRRRPLTKFNPASYPAYRKCVSPRTPGRWLICQLWTCELDHGGLAPFMFRLDSLPRSIPLSPCQRSRSGKAPRCDFVVSNLCAAIEVKYTTV